VIQCANEIGANRIIFELDASTLVQALKSNDCHMSSIGVVVKEARSLCTLNFDSFQFSSCCRTCNNATHELAKLGENSEPFDSHWEGPTPSCITTILDGDLPVPV
jgi:hypothetical protein